MRKSIILTLTLVMLFTISLFVFSADEVILKDPKVSTMPQGVYGGTLITSMVSDPNTFNIILSNDNASNEVIAYRIFEGLAHINPLTGKYEPALARKWETSEDGLTWTFYLRRGVQWNDGIEFTADDVLFTFDLIYDENIPNSFRDSLTINGQKLKYKKLDKYTVAIITPEPFAPLLSTVPFILPKHKLYDAWEAGKFNEMWGINTDPKELVGTGPYTLASYKPGQRLVYLRNSKYWMVSPDGKSLPYITRWINEIVPNVESALLKFENGETHISAIKPQDFERVKAGEETSDYTVHFSGTSFTSTLISFNLNPQNPEFKEKPWKLKWFNNIHFRHALDYATDRETMAEQINVGMAEPQWSPEANANKFWLNHNVRKYPYSLEKAKEELKAGGFNWNNDGKLVDKDGHLVEFTILTTETFKPWIDTMNIMKNDYEQLGMKVYASPIAFGSLVQKLMNNFEFDLIIIGLAGSGTEPHGGSNVWKSDGNLHMWNPQQEKPATKWEARLNELFYKGCTTLDPAQRKVYYDEYQAIIAEQIPVFYTVASKTYIAVRNNLKNIQPSSLGGDIYNGSITWDIPNLYFGN